MADAHGPVVLLLFDKAAPTQKPGGYGTGRQWRPLDQALAVLWQTSAWREELIQLLELLAERADRRLHPLPWALPVPLRVHGHYTRAEIEATHCYAEACGYGVLTDDAPWIHREGVLAHQASATDLLFITLRKSEALFSPSTRYRDLALGPSLFHWESQSTTANNANRTAAPVPPPNPSCASASGSATLACGQVVPATKATGASGRWRGGISVAARAGDPGGVVTGNGVGGLNSQHLSRFVHPSSSSEPSRILRARLRWLANSTNSACSSAEVSKPG